MKTIAIELPDDLLPRLRETPESLGRELRLAAAIGWLRLGRVSTDEAADVAGLGRPEFDAALAEATAVTRPETETESSERPFLPEEAETQYGVLGVWKGPSAARDVQRAAREYWLGAGSAGARWLVARLRDEIFVETLHAVGSVLADLGEVAIGPIVDGLLADPAHDQAIVLLDAIAIRH
jgi:hypothetical protein